MRHRDDGDVHARERADLRREHARRVDDDLRLDRRALAALRDLDARHPPAFDADPDDPRLRADRTLRARARPRPGPGPVPMGRASRRSGGDGPEHAVRRHQGEQRRASSRPDQLQRQSEGSAQAACRRSSSMRAGVDARRREPTSCQPGRRRCRPQRAGRARVPYIIIRVRLSVLRSCPTRPAEWNVEPLVSSARSTQHDVLPAELREVIRDAGAADAAADDRRRAPVPRSQQGEVERQASGRTAALLHAAL